MQIGDEVICVGNELQCRCRVHDRTPHRPPEYRDPEIGRHYIVAHVGMGGCVGCGMELPLMTPVGRDRLGCPRPYGWLRQWFRPLEHDEEPEKLEVPVRTPVVLEPV